MNYIDPQIKGTILLLNAIKAIIIMVRQDAHSHALTSMTTQTDTCTHLPTCMLIPGMVAIEEQAVEAVLIEELVVGKINVKGVDVQTSRGTFSQNKSTRCSAQRDNIE